MLFEAEPTLFTVALAAPATPAAITIVSAVTGLVAVALATAVVAVTGSAQIYFTAAQKYICCWL